MICIRARDQAAETQMMLICVTSTHTHRKCNKALSGELIVSSRVLVSVPLLCGRFLEFAAEECYR